MKSLDCRRDRGSSGTERPLIVPPMKTPCKEGAVGTIAPDRAAEAAQAGSSGKSREELAV